MDILVQHVSKGIGLVLLLSMPAVLLAAGIGLIVGILQAVTQVQEQTIAAAPKIFLVFMLIIFGGPFMMDILKEFLEESVYIGLQVIPKDELMVLPPKPRLAYGEANSRLDFFKEKRRAPSTSKIKNMANQSSPVQSISTSASQVYINSTKPNPKTGVGEQIYLQRRSAGTLPKPPGGGNG